MGCSFAALSGTGCRTSQCSTTLPSFKRKKFRYGSAAVFGWRLQQAVRHDHVALGHGALDLEARLGELSREALLEPDERTPRGAQERLRGDVRGVRWRGVVTGSEELRLPPGYRLDRSDPDVWTLSGLDKRQTPDPAHREHA